MTGDELLMVFVKNSELGKVKTRLAKTVGDDKALEIYKRLLDFTLKITRNVSCDKAVFYSDFTEPGDQWSNAGYDRLIQEGDDLGERMSNAFKVAFSRKYKKVVIIGSDCLELTAQIISDAFLALEKAEMVVGPATDGGYYLLGMKKLQPEIFKNKRWSTSHVLSDTINDMSKLNVPVKLLPVLSDIDEARDLILHHEFFKSNSNS